MRAQLENNDDRCSSGSATRRIRHMLRSRRRRESGAALVEFALVLPILSILLFGMLDLGKAFNYWIDETHLANEGARWAVVDKNPDTSGTKTLQQYIKDQADTAQLRTDAAVHICFPNGTSNVGDPVKVIVEDDYSFLGPLTHTFRGLSGPVVTAPTTRSIAGSAVMRLEAEPTSYAADISSSSSLCQNP